MANVRNSNTFYVDTQSAGASDDLIIKNIKVSRVYVTATAANAIVNLQDAASSPVNKINLRVATSGDTAEFWFGEDGILFPNGIKVNTLTNAVATLIVKESRG